MTKELVVKCLANYGTNIRVCYWNKRIGGYNDRLIWCSGSIRPKQGRDSDSISEVRLYSFVVISEHFLLILLDSLFFSIIMFC